MKKLEIKSAVPRNGMTKAESIMHNTRRDLKDFIAFEGESIYRLLNNGSNPDFGGGEDWVIGKKDFGALKVKVELKDTYLSETEWLTAEFAVEEIHIALDKSVFLYLDGPIGETDLTDISTDEMAKVCNALEKAYLRLIRK